MVSVSVCPQFGQVSVLFNTTVCLVIVSLIHDWLRRPTLVHGEIRALESLQALI